MNIQNIMAQAQKMQKDIAKKKEEIDKQIFPGKSEWVEMEFNGKKELVSMKITKTGAISEDEFDVLEDMISIAIKDAISNIDKEVSSKMGSYGSALDGLI